MRPVDGAGAAKAVDRILRSRELTRAQKIDALTELAYDEREAQVAADEGMIAAPSRLGQILRALRELGGRPEPRGDAKH